MLMQMFLSLIVSVNAQQYFRNFPQVNGRGDSIQINSVVASEHMENWSQQLTSFQAPTGRPGLQSQERGPGREALLALVGDKQVTYKLRRQEIE